MGKNPYQNLIAEILGTRPVAFNRDLARVLGSAKAGLLLSQFLYWWDKGHKPGWIYKTIVEVESETTLTRREQDTAIRICKEKGVLKVELKGIPAKRHFQLNIDKITELVTHGQYSLLKIDKQVCTKPPNLFTRKDQTITENTPKKTYKDISLQETVASPIEYLSNIPEKDMLEFTERFVVTKENIKCAAKDLQSRCETLDYKGRDYRAALFRIIKCSFKERFVEKSKYANLQ